MRARKESCTGIYHVMMPGIDRQLFILNNNSPEVILPYINQDVCVKRVFKKGLLQNVFIYELVV